MTLPVVTFEAMCLLRHMMAGRPQPIMRDLPVREDGHFSSYRVNDRDGGFWSLLVERSSDKAEYTISGCVGSSVLGVTFELAPEDLPLTSLDVLSERYLRPAIGCLITKMLADPQYSRNCGPAITPRHQEGNLGAD
jgi:hypothetical protein